MTIIIPGSPEWLKERRNYVTASMSPVIMGDSPWQTISELYWNIVNEVEIPTNPAMQRGIDLEPEARAIFIQETGIWVEPQWVVSTVYPWMAASFDGLSADGKTGLEVKCPGKAGHMSVLKKAPEAKYFAQIQHQMIVADLETWSYMSYRPEERQKWTILKVHRVPPYCNALITQTKHFWDRVQARIPYDI